jgi:hypothetical protein
MARFQRRVREFGPWRRCRRCSTLSFPATTYEKIGKEAARTFSALPPPTG